MKLPCVVLAMLFCLPIAAQNMTNAAPDPLKPLNFLEGTWDAKVRNNADVSLSGRCTFTRELSGHILARHSTNDLNCKAPASFDCAHHDLLSIFQDASGSALQAIYFDNEGHVIHYEVSTLTPTSVVFLSLPAPGPRFRLSYELRTNVMTGRFQMQMPGQSEWRTYLEWSGSRR